MRGCFEDYIDVNKLGMRGMHTWIGAKFYTVAIVVLTINVLSLFLYHSIVILTRIVKRVFDKTHYKKNSFKYYILQHSAARAKCGKKCKATSI